LLQRLSPSENAATQIACKNQARKKIFIRIKLLPIQVRLADGESLSTVKFFDRRASQATVGFHDEK